MTILNIKFKIGTVVQCSKGINLSNAMFGLVRCCVAVVVEMLAFRSFLLVMAWCDICS